MLHLLRVLVVLAAVQCALAARTNLRESETELLRLLLNPDRYDKRVRPPVHNETSLGSDDFILVRVNTYIRSFGPIDDHNKDYTMSLTLRQTWNDRRLQFSPQDQLKYITLTSIDDIWSPDLFFSNEKEGRINDLLKPNELVRISHNGDVLYSTRVTIKLSCPLNMTNFPMDDQLCHMRMASYAYPTNALRFIWQEEEPVQFVSSLNAKPFEIIGYKTDNCNSKTLVGEYSCIRLHFYLARLAYGYILHLFLPLGLLVVASWAPLWLDIQGESPILGIIGRCLIALICFLTTISEAARVTTSAPLCSGYSCTVDIWTTWCQVFVALVLLVVIVVSAYELRRNGNQCKSSPTKDGCFTMAQGGTESVDTKFEPHRNKMRKWLMGWPSTGQRIYIISRILFPLAFVIFNVAYWSVHSKSLDADLLSSMKKIPI